MRTEPNVLNQTIWYKYLDLTGPSRRKAMATPLVLMLLV